MDENVKHHHFLISGEVVFANTKTQQVGTVRLNGVLITDRDDLPMRSLGKAQQILQLNFIQTMGEMEDTKVVDVVLHNFVHLGHFTKAEFHEPPAGTELQIREVQNVAQPAEAQEEQKPHLSLVPKEDALEKAVADAAQQPQQ